MSLIHVSPGFVLFLIFQWHDPRCCLLIHTVLGWFLQEGVAALVARSQRGLPAARCSAPCNYRVLTALRTDIKGHCRPFVWQTRVVFSKRACWSRVLVRLGGENILGISADAAHGERYPVSYYNELFVWNQDSACHRQPAHFHLIGAETQTRRASADAATSRRVGRRPM